MTFASVLRLIAKSHMRIICDTGDDGSVHLNNQYVAVNTRCDGPFDLPFEFSQSRYIIVSFCTVANGYTDP